MTRKRITDLTAITGANVLATDDVVPIVDVSEVGVADRNKKIKVSELVANTPSFVQSGTGASTGTVQEELRSRAINAVTQFGLSTGGTASANYAALSNALAAASSQTKAVYIPGGNYSIDPSGGILTLNCTLFGDGLERTILTIAGNGNLFQRSSASVLQDLTINMVGATYSGHACMFAASSARQIDRGVYIKNLASGKYALNFAADGGSQFNSFGCNYHTLATAGSDAAVKVTGTDTAATPRSFFGTNGDGCTVFDLGGCNDFFIYGGFTNGLLFSSDTASKALIFGLRVGTVSGTVTINGDGHKIKGCVFADPVVLDTDTSSIDFDSEVTNSAITDNGTSNSIAIPRLTYTPAWTSSGTQPAIVDGTITGTYSVKGRDVTATIVVIMGASTTFGTGTYSFSLPYTSANLSNIQFVGSVRALDSGTNHIAGAAMVAGNASTCQLYFDGATAAAGQTVPIAWANGDQINIQITYTKA